MFTTPRSVHRSIQFDSIPPAVARLGAGTLLVLSAVASPAQEVAVKPPAAAAAAASAPAPNVSQLEAVVVTAQKRTESLQDVPLSVSVIGSAGLKNMGAQNFTDLISSVPSLASFQTGPGRSQLIMRGVTTGGVSEDDPQTQETVGLYVDESPISVNGFNPEFGFFDLERVEVLRGPQGTLYGAGAMSGAVKLVTRKPDLYRFGGSVEGDVGQIRFGGTNADARGVVNVPLIDGKLAVRASAFHSTFGGYIDNTQTGEKDLNRSHTNGGRIALRATPTDSVIVDLSYFGQKTGDGGRPIDEGTLARSYASPEGSEARSQLLNGTVNVDLGWGDFVSSSSFLKFDITNRRELDKLLATVTTAVNGALADQTHLTDFTQEFRLASKDEGPFKWLAGVYFNHRIRDYVNNFPVPGFDAATGIDNTQLGAPADSPFYGYDNVDVVQGALFGEATYTIGPVALTAGLRSFHWRENFFLYSSGVFNGGITTTGQREATESGNNPKFNATYKIDKDQLVYVQAAKGFRFGGINQIVPLNLCQSELTANNLAVPASTYASDSLWNYEVGDKATWLDGRLTVNASAFLIKWKDIQANRGLNCGFSYRENAAGLTSKGLELETTLRPIPGLTLTAGGSYVNATLDQDVPDLAAVAGDRAPFVPKVSYNTSAEYRFPVGGGAQAFLWGSWQHVGQRATNFNPALASYRSMGAYNVVNLRGGVSFGQVEMSLYVKNLTDSRGTQRALSATPFDAEGAYRITPRTIGVTSRVAF